MAELIMPMAASGLTAPVVLIEVQTAAGVNYFWSDHKASWPSVITGAPELFLDRLLDADFTLTGSVETDTAEFTLENLSGDTVNRNSMLAFTATELVGALVVMRIWRGDAMTALLTFVGMIDEVEPDEQQMRVSVEGFGNWSAIQALDNIDVTCPRTFGSVACGSTSPTPCDQTYGTCSQINRFAGVVTQWDTESPNQQLAQPAPAVFRNTLRAF